ncbi:MAG: 4Fe-4S binding protein [Candidatus Cloacimonetes bacterium]|nr:4Fe-4S binding protein [Candidatus Cloacimonadota bacterium]
MKYLKVHSEKCTGCKACEEACSQAFFKEKTAEKSSIRILENEGKFEITVCNQCGNCCAMCQPQALTKGANGVVTINKQECVGCLICVAECPCKVMRYHGRENIPFKCIACGVCVSKCPAGALELVKE